VRKTKEAFFLIALSAVILFVFAVLIEVVTAGLRYTTGRVVLRPDVDYLFGRLSPNVSSQFHPCNRMKTDVLLGHVHDTSSGQCDVKGGTALLDEYVVYADPESSDFFVPGSIPKTPQLLTLGGSTTDGFYQDISLGETWPKILSEMLEGKLTVINGGVGGYGSLQELNKFVRDGPRFANLEYVVSFNGINDMPGYPSGTPGEELLRSLDSPFLTNVQNQMNRQQRFVDQSHRVSFSSAMNFLLPNIYHSISGISYRILQPMTPKDTLFRPLDAGERWEINVRRLNAMVSLVGAQHILILQPTMGASPAQSTAPLGSADASLLSKISDRDLFKTRQHYDDLRARCKTLVFCHDLTDIAPPRGNHYNDSRHHSALGNRVIAEKIRDIILDGADAGQD
jgi:hypothetical protein